MAFSRFLLGKPDLPGHIYFPAHCLGLLQAQRRAYLFLLHPILLRPRLYGIHAGGQHVSGLCARFPGNERSYSGRAVYIRRSAFSARRRQPLPDISNHTYIHMRACTRLYGGILYGREQPGEKFSISDCFPAGYGRMHYVPVYKAV